jgi:hypothetical protein
LRFVLQSATAVARRTPSPLGDHAQDGAAVLAREEEDENAKAQRRKGARDEVKGS